MPYKTIELFDLNFTIATKLFESQLISWEVLPYISNFIIELGKTLPTEIYEQVLENIWVAKNTDIAQTASISGPCIIDEGAQIRHCAFIRENAIIGKNAVVGNSTELKNCILFDGVQVPHFNYIGDSVLGHMAHFGAGAVTSNVKSDKSNVDVKFDNNMIKTGMKKLGAMVGDYSEVGCNSVLCPGTVLGKGSQVYPTSCVRGIVPAGCIFKSTGEIVQKY